MEKILNKLPVFIISVSGESIEQIFQVFIYPEVIRFRCLDQTVKDSTRLSTAYRVYVDLVLPTECEWTNGPFSDVIVHWNSTIGKKDAQELFLIDAVLKALIGIASGRNFRHGIFHPRKGSINLRLTTS